LAHPVLEQARVIIPVRNGGPRWREAAARLRECVPDPSVVVVVDSSSGDGSDAVAVEHGFVLHRIDVRTFNHGRTRQEAVEQFCAGKPYVVFLTQDAIVENDATLVSVLESFADPQVGAAYGRQLPHRDAQPFEAHFASFNYPPLSQTRTLADTKRLGIKAAYLSNSFAAYRTEALIQCGGFPDHLILGEDGYVAMKMLVSGWRIRYCSEALVRHSHAYSLVEEAHRYFDFGVAHAQMAELLERFGNPEGEGLRLVRSELRYIRSVAPRLVPQVVLRNAARYFFYRLGRSFSVLPESLCRRLSMTKVYWEGARRYENTR
jgi:rhamnosyltransferase